MTWLIEVKWREKTWARDDTQFSIFLFIIRVFINGFCLEHIHVDCFCYIRMCNKLLVKSKFFFLVSKRLLAICRIKDKRLDGSPGVLCTSLYRMSSGKSIAGSCANSSTPRGLKDDVFVCVCVCVCVCVLSCGAWHSDLSPWGRTYPLKRSVCSSSLQIHLSPGSSFSTSFPLPRQISHLPFLFLSYSSHRVRAQLPVVSDSLPLFGACQAPRSMEFFRQAYWRGLLFPTPTLHKEMKRQDKTFQGEK